MVEEVEKANDWERLGFYNDDFFTLYTEPNQLIVQTASFHVRIDSSRRWEYCTDIGNSSYRDPINEQYTVNQGGQFIRIANTETFCDNTFIGTFTLSLESQVDPLVMHPTLWTPSRSLSRMLLNDDGLIFLPYRVEGEDEQAVNFALIQLGPGDSNVAATLESVELITDTGLKAWTYPFIHSVVPDGFIFTLIGNLSENQRGVFKLDPSGEIRQVYNRRATTLFQFQEDLYILNVDSEMLRSTDNGETWSSAYFFGSNDVNITDWVEVDNQLFGLVRDKVVVATLTEDSFSTRELDTEELAFQEITHLAKLGDDAVLFTSAGIFFRDWEEFMAEE